MKIEVDFDDVLNDYVENVSRACYSMYDDDIKEYCEKLIMALPNYERGAQVIYDLLQGNSYIKKAFDEIVGENKE